MPYHGVNTVRSQELAPIDSNLRNGPPPAPRRCGEVIFVLPAYNEEANIGGLLHSIQQAMVDGQLPWRVIAVNDGSKDRTGEILARCGSQVPLTVFDHPVNQGLGPTIRDGLRLATESMHDGDIVITMDSDGTHDPGLVPRMVSLIRDGHDVVIASRYRPGAKVFGLNGFRTLMSNAASWIFRLALPIPGVRDYTCGFRAYSGASLKKVHRLYGDKLVEMSGFHCMADILIKCGKSGLICGEVPMILRYDLKGGASKMPVVKTVGQTLALLIRRRFSSSWRRG
jgi:dolichol-phosphate mannosyltransferase